MAKCNQCGAELMDGTKFCPNCGAKVEEKPKRLFCPQCGQEVDPSAAFCPNCGFKLGEKGPAPQPVPQPAPRPVPQQAPVYQQPYYPQQPVNNYAPNNTQPRGPLPLVRSLVVNIGTFLIYLMLLLVLVIPIVQGASYNYFNVFSMAFNFSGSEGFSILYHVISLLVYLLPLVGFLTFGTIALVNGIKSLIHRTAPNYGTLGFAFGFYAPLFLSMIGMLNVQTNDFFGFTFPLFQYSPAYTLFFVTFVLYLAFGVTNSFLTSRIEKKPIVGPILKASAAFVGIFLFIFIFGATVSTTNGSGISISPMWLYENSVTLMMSSSEYSSLGFLLFFHGIIYMLSVIYCGMLFGEMFSNSRRKANHVSTLVMTSISSGLSVFSIAALASASGYSGFLPGMPSACGDTVLILVIALLVLRSITLNKERPVLRQPMPAPRYPNY